jgi:hypothetical protein
MTFAGRRHCVRGMVSEVEVLLAKRAFDIGEFDVHFDFAFLL